MRQLTIEHFQKPLKGEHQLLESESAHEFRSISNKVTLPEPEALAVPVPLALRPFVGTPEQPAPRLYSRAELICVLTSHLPLNDYKLPTLLYRPDLLDHAMFNDIREKEYQKALSFLETAEVTVTYHEGYPCIQSQPIWTQLPWEGTEDFQLFQKYLDLPGARQLHLLGGEGGARAQALFHTNYWNLRVQASDSFAVAHFQRMREQRVLRSDDKLFLESEQLLARLYRLAPEIEWDLLKTEPDKFVKVMGQLVEMQRKSLATTQQEPGRAAQPVEVIMRQMVKTDDDEAKVTTITEEGDLDIRDILRQAGDVKSLQELVLRVGQK